MDAAINLAAAVAAPASPPPAAAAAGDNPAVAFLLSLPNAAPAAACVTTENALVEGDDPAAADATVLSWLQAFCGQAPAAAPAIGPQATDTPVAALPVDSDAAEAMPVTAALPDTTVSLVAVVEADAAPVEAGPAPDAPAPGFERFEAWMNKIEAQPIQHASAAQAAMSVAPDHADWADEFSQHVVWTARDSLHSAEIKLHPQELGSIAVRMEMEADQVRVSFSTTQTQASHAIEQSLPRLRELFAHEGLNLAQVQVSAQTAQDQARQQSRTPGRYTAGRAATEPAPLVGSAATFRRVGLLDDYA